MTMDIEEYREDLTTYEGEDLIRFQWSEDADGFLEAVDVLNKLLKVHNLKIKHTYIEQDDGTEDYVWAVKIEENDNGKI